MIDCKKWRSLQGDITTSSLWISSFVTKSKPLFLIPRRDWGFKNSREFHGIFIPEIPYQFIRRFCPENGVIWDCFGGSGTTYYTNEFIKKTLNETYELYINDLTPKCDFISQGDSRTYKIPKKADLVFVHPPYKNIIKYSDKAEDGSNHTSLEDYLKWGEEIATNIIPQVNSNGVIIIVCGNYYENGEEVDLGVYFKDVFVRVGEGKVKCKSHIIKDYGETKGSDGKNFNLNYFRQLKNGFNNFYGDNIFILRKSK